MLERWSNRRASQFFWLFAFRCIVWQILGNAFSWGIHFDGYTIFSRYFQDDDDFAYVPLGMDDSIDTQCLWLRLHISWRSLFVCVYVAEQAASMQNCCLVRWKYTSSVWMYKWVTHLRMFKSHAFSTSVLISQSYRHVIKVSCRSSWKAASYIDQVTCVSLGYLTLAHECLQVGVVPLTVMWCSYT